MQFNALTAQLDSLKNLNALAAQLAEAKAAHRAQLKEVLPAAEEQLLAALKEVGGKASTFLYGKAFDPASGEELCIYIKGNAKPAKGTIAAVWGYWETPVTLGLEQITGLLSEADYNVLYEAEDKAYQAAEEAEAQRIEQEKADKLAAKEKAKQDRLNAKNGAKGAGEEQSGDGADAAAGNVNADAGQANAEGGEAAPAPADAGGDATPAPVAEGGAAPAAPAAPKAPRGPKAAGAVPKA